MAKSARTIVKMVSTADTGYYKMTTEAKNKKMEPKKMFDPRIRKHVLFKRKTSLK